MSPVGNYNNTELIIHIPDSFESEKVNELIDVVSSKLDSMGGGAPRNMIVTKEPNTIQINVEFLGVQNNSLPFRHNSVINIFKDIHNRFGLTYEVKNITKHVFKTRLLHVLSNNIEVLLIKSDSNSNRKMVNPISLSF